MEPPQSIQDHDPRKIRIKFLLRFGSIKASKTENKRTKKKTEEKPYRESQGRRDTKERKKPKQGEGRLEKKQTKTEGKKRALPN
jgi:hypothetical protein